MTESIIHTNYRIRLWAHSVACSEESGKTDDAGVGDRQNDGNGLISNCRTDGRLPATATKNRFRLCSVLCWRLDRAIEALLQAGCLAHALAQVVEFGAACPTPTQDFHAIDAGGVEQKNPLNANSLEGFANGDVLVNPGTALGDHDSFVGLCPFLAPFLDDHTDFNRVPDVDDGEIRLHLFRFNGADNFVGVHGSGQKLTVL